MTHPPAPVAGIPEVLSLTAALADQVYAAHINGRPVPVEQTVALVKAAQLLREIDVEWPSCLSAALREVAADFGEVEPDEVSSAMDDQAGRIVHLIGALHRDKASP